MLGYYVGDLVLFKGTNIIGVIIETPKFPDGFFKVRWNDGTASFYFLKDIRTMKYALEDRLSEYSSVW